MHFCCSSHVIEGISKCIYSFLNCRHKRSQNPFDVLISVGTEYTLDLYLPYWLLISFFLLAFFFSISFHESNLGLCPHSLYFLHLFPISNSFGCYNYYFYDYYYYFYYYYYYYYIWYYYYNSKREREYLFSA